MDEAFLHPRREDRIPQLDTMEVSAGFHPDALPIFLWDLPALIQEDFGPEQVRQLIETADSLQLNEARRIPYRATFRGRRIDFRIILYRYEQQTIGFYLKAPYSFAGEVQKRIDRFLGHKKTA